VEAGCCGAVVEVCGAPLRGHCQQLCVVCGSRRAMCVGGWCTPCVYRGCFACCSLGASRAGLCVRSRGGGAPLLLGSVLHVWCSYSPVQTSLGVCLRGRRDACASGLWVLAAPVVSQAAACPCMRCSATTCLAGRGKSLAACHLPGGAAPVDDIRGGAPWHRCWLRVTCLWALR
jgi:hypothetical protein